MPSASSTPCQLNKTLRAPLNSSARTGQSLTFDTLLGSNVRVVCLPRHRFAQDWFFVYTIVDGTIRTRTIGNWLLHIAALFARNGRDQADYCACTHETTVCCLHCRLLTGCCRAHQSSEIVRVNERNQIITAELKAQRRVRRVRAGKQDVWDNWNSAFMYMPGRFAHC